MGKIFKRIGTIIDSFDTMSEDQRRNVLIRRGFRTQNTRNVDFHSVGGDYHMVEQPVYGWVRAVSFEEYIHALNALPPIENMIARPDQEPLTHRVYIEPENGSYYLFRVVFGDGVPHWALDGTVLVRKVAKNVE